jgi:hypothetical protein
MSPDCPKLDIPEWMLVVPELRRLSPDPKTASPDDDDADLPVETLTSPDVLAESADVTTTFPDKLEPLVPETIETLPPKSDLE